MNFYRSFSFRRKKKKKKTVCILPRLLWWLLIGEQKRLDSPTGPLKKKMTNGFFLFFCFSASSLLFFSFSFPVLCAVIVGGGPSFIIIFLLEKSVGSEFWRGPRRGRRVRVRRSAVFCEPLSLVRSLFVLFLFCFVFFCWIFRQQQEEKKKKKETRNEPGLVASLMAVGFSCRHETQPLWTVFIIPIALPLETRLIDDAVPRSGSSFRQCSLAPNEVCWINWLSTMTSLPSAVNRYSSACVCSLCFAFFSFSFLCVCVCVCACVCVCVFEVGFSTLLSTLFLRARLILHQTKGVASIRLRLSFRFDCFRPFLSHSFIRPIDSF